MPLETGEVRCFVLQERRGNWTPASHLTGFLHTLGSVFQLSHQILKNKQPPIIFNRNKAQHKTQPKIMNRKKYLAYAMEYTL